jgi:hypothetical protein
MRQIVILLTTAKTAVRTAAKTVRAMLLTALEKMQRKTAVKIPAMPQIVTNAGKNVRQGAGSFWTGSFTW